MQRNDIIIDKYEIDEVRLLIKSYYVIYRIAEVILYHEEKSIFNKVFNIFNPDKPTNNQVEKYLDWLFIEKTLKRINTKRPLFLVPDFYHPDSVKKYGMITILLMEFQIELLNKVYELLGNRKVVSKKVYSINSDKSITFSKYKNELQQTFSFDTYISKLKIKYDKDKSLIDNVIFNILKDKFLLKQFSNRFIFLSVFGEDFIIYDEKKLTPEYDMLTDKIEEFVKRGVDYKYLSFFDKKGKGWLIKDLTYNDFANVTYIDVNKQRKTKDNIKEVILYILKQLIGRVLIISDGFYDNIVNFKDDLFVDENDNLYDEDDDFDEDDDLF